MEEEQYLNSVKEKLRSLNTDIRRKELALHDLLGIAIGSLQFIDYSLSSKEGKSEEGEMDFIGFFNELRDLITKGKVDLDLLRQKFAEKKEMIDFALSILEQYKESKEFSFLIRMSRFLLKGGLEMLVLSAAFLLEASLEESNDKCLKELLENLEGFRFNLSEIVNIFVSNSEIPKYVEVNWAGALIFLNLLRNARQAVSLLGDPEAISVLYLVEEGVNVVRIENESEGGLPAGYGTIPIEKKDRGHYGGFLVAQIFPLFAKMYVGGDEGKELEVDFESEEVEEKYRIISTVRTEGYVFKDK